MVHLFSRKSNIMYRKVDKAVHQNSACSQPAILPYMTEFTGKPSAPFERAFYFGLDTMILPFTLHVFDIRT